MAFDYCISKTVKRYVLVRALTRIILLPENAIWMAQTVELIVILQFVELFQFGLNGAHVPSLVVMVPEHAIGVSNGRIIQLISVRLRQMIVTNKHVRRVFLFAFVCIKNLSFLTTL